MADKKTKKVAALSVRARPTEGFWRAKRFWPAEETIVSIAALGADAVKALRAEGALKKGKLIVLDATIEETVEEEPKA